MQRRGGRMPAPGARAARRAGWSRRRRRRERWRKRRMMSQGFCVRGGARAYDFRAWHQQAFTEPGEGRREGSGPVGVPEDGGQRWGFGPGCRDARALKKTRAALMSEFLAWHFSGRSHQRTGEQSSAALHCHAHPRRMLFLRIKRRPPSHFIPAPTRRTARNNDALSLSARRPAPSSSLLYVQQNTVTMAGIEGESRHAVKIARCCQSSRTCPPRSHARTHLRSRRRRCSPGASRAVGAALEVMLMLCVAEHSGNRAH
jgi:hypothetical protein